MTRSFVSWSVRVGTIAAALVVVGNGCSSDDPAVMGPAIGAGSGAPAVTAGTTAAGSTAAVGGGVIPRAGTTGALPPVGVVAGAPGTGGAGRIGGTAGTPGAIGGTPAPAGASGGVAGMPAGAAGGTGVTMTPTGAAPPLPEIKGECPMFMSGSTIMVAGHKSIAITAGAPGKGGPLLFYWHGTGGNASEAMRSLPAAVRSEIMSMGGIIAAFNGNQSSGTGGDCSGTAAHNKADFDAADQIAACAVKNHGIDARRIYATGCSAGGLQSGCMAQMRSSYLAASAPNSGGVVISQAWQDKHSPAIFTMHGGTSDKVGVAFSDTSRTLDMNAKTHGSFVVNCDHGGGHCKAPPELQSAAWQFMKDHPWGFTASPWAMMIPAGVPNYCKVF